MATVNVYRYFDQDIKPGVRPYKRTSDKLPKSQAQEIARNARRRGHLARIVKESDGYAVFIKK